MGQKQYSRCTAILPTYLLVYGTKFRHVQNFRLLYFAESRWSNVSVCCFFEMPSGVYVGQYENSITPTIFEQWTHTGKWWHNNIPNNNSATSVYYCTRNTVTFFYSEAYRGRKIKNRKTHNKKWQDNTTSSTHFTGFDKFAPVCVPNFPSCKPLEFVIIQNNVGWCTQPPFTWIFWNSLVYNSNIFLVFSRINVF